MKTWSDSISIEVWKKMNVVVMVNPPAPNPLMFLRCDLFSKTSWLQPSWRLLYASLSLAPRRNKEKTHNQTMMLTIMRTAEAWSFVSVAAGQGGNELPWWLWVRCLVDWCLMRACLMVPVSERDLRRVCEQRGKEWGGNEKSVKHKREEKLFR